MRRLDVSDREVIRGIVTWGPAATWAAVLFLLSAMSDVPGASWLPWGDKVGHLGLYAVLGSTLAWARWRGGAGLPHGLFVLVGLLYALSDEWHQSFVPGRDSSAADLLADGCGAFAGYAVSCLLLVRRESEGGALSPRPGR